MSIVSEPEETAPPLTPPAPPTPTRSVWKGLALRLHFYAGLFAAPFILVAAVTGALYALAPQIEKWVYADQLTTASVGPELPLATQIEAALATNPGGELDAVRTPPEPGATTRVLFNREDTASSSERWTVFVDPVTAEVKGEMVTYGGSGALPLRTTISQLHRNLMLGEPGRIYSEMAASWMWFVALGGLVLWVAKWRAKRTRKVADLVRPEAGVKGRRKLAGRHGALGVWLLLGMLFLSATGLTWSTYAGANISTIRSDLGWTTPALETGAASGGGHDGHGSSAPAEPLPPVSPATFDVVLAAARAAGIDAMATEVAAPASAGAAWTVSEIKSSLPNEADKAAVDPTGTVTDLVRFSDWPFMAKLTTWTIAGHMGTLFGIANQLLLLAFAVGLVAVILLGYRMWWVRRPTRGGLPSPLVPRGQFRKLSQPVGFLVVLGAVAIGWFAPLFGISLVAFLAFDAWRGHRATKA